MGIYIKDREDGELISRSLTSHIALIEKALLLHKTRHTDHNSVITEHEQIVLEAELDHATRLLLELETATFIVQDSLAPDEPKSQH